MLRKMGRSRARARASASFPHGYQSTGLCACCRRYGLVSEMRWLVYFGVPSGLRWLLCILGSAGNCILVAAPQPSRAPMLTPHAPDESAAPLLRLKRGEERRLAAGHPWVFS